jgi:hypothetical protein
MFDGRNTVFGPATALINSIGELFVAVFAIRISDKKIL